MDTLQQLPAHGDGLLDMRKLARTLLETMVNEIMDAQADMACEDVAAARNGYRERGLATPVGDIVLRIGSVPKVGVGPGSLDSLRPSSRSEPYTNFRDTTSIAEIIRFVHGYSIASHVGFTCISLAISCAPLFPVVLICFA